MMRFVKYFVAGTVMLILIIASICFQPAHTEPYAQQEYYQKELEAIAAKPLSSRTNDTLQCGWAGLNLTPTFTTPIAIDAARGGKHFTGVRDSLYVRAFVFKQGHLKFAFVSADLLIIPPNVAAGVSKALQSKGYSPHNIYLSATHTHTGIGGWYNSTVGKIFAGKYDERVPAHITATIAKCVALAEGNLQKVQVGYTETPLERFVVNRLVGDSGIVDNKMRIIKLVNDSGATAAIVTHSAHATIFHEKEMKLSGDWPAGFMQAANSTRPNCFVSFTAGAVGSHGPFLHSANREEELAYMVGQSAAAFNSVFDSIACSAVTELSGMRYPLWLRQPILRVADQLAIRPWLFYYLFGNEASYLQTLNIGNITLAGLPCDFSGELAPALDSAAQRNNKHLMVTGFNGGYIGYVTHPKWYHLNAYETRTMGWFGPDTGSYLSELISRLLGL